MMHGYDFIKRHGYHRLKLFNIKITIDDNDMKIFYVFSDIKEHILCFVNSWKSDY